LDKKPSHRSLGLPLKPQQNLAEMVHYASNQGNRLPQNRTEKKKETSKNHLFLWQTGL
jgi:hypothetical protein